MNGRKNGSMISMSTEKSVAYALDALQERGRLFVVPARMLRRHDRGRVVEGRRHGGQHRQVEAVGQPAFVGADKAISLTPPITFTLEEALEYIEDDELVEVTPESIRLRKRILSTIERKKVNKK